MGAALGSWDSSELMPPAECSVELDEVSGSSEVGWTVLAESVKQEGPEVQHLLKQARVCRSNRQDPL